MFQLFDEGRQRTFSLTGLIKEIGRGDECDIAIAEDPSLSRVHARLDRQGEDWVLVDLESTNGTFVNGERVREARLKPGDLIELGDTRLRFLPAPVAGQAVQKKTTKVNMRPVDEEEKPRGIFSRVKTVLTKK